jgi:hypothetical protein
VTRPQNVPLRSSGGPAAGKPVATTPLEALRAGIAAANNGATG